MQDIVRFMWKKTLNFIAEKDIINMKKYNFLNEFKFLNYYRNNLFSKFNVAIVS